jgi:hypothetical protein
MQIVLDQKALSELNNFIQELPLKYGLPLVNFINQKIKEQNEEVVVEETK